MANPNVLGQFVWHELLTTDTKAAATFYVKVAAWKTQPWAQDRSYTMLMAEKRPVGGLMVLPEQARKMGTPPNWLTYLGTPDVEHTILKAVGLGARVLTQPTDIPTVGRFAVLQDPQGAVFALITMAQQPPVSDAAPSVGDFSWHELATTDATAAWKFYSRLFGWKATESMNMGPAGVYQMFGLGASSVGGMYTKPKEMPGPSAWTPYIKVTNSKQVAKKAPGLGGKILNGPMEVPGGDWIVMGMDPQGAVFATHSVKAATVQRTAAKAAAAKPARAGRKTTRAAAKTPARKAVKPARSTKKSAPAKGRAGTPARKGVRRR